MDGLGARPLSVSLAGLRAMPHRTQITRHDCVEGWSAIGQWTGTPLNLLLREAGVRRAARYIVFHCADTFGSTPYYESIDLIDAFHPQTILAWGLNGHLLGVDHGAPVRLRVERPNTSCARKRSRAWPASAVARAAIGRTSPTTNGTPAFEAMGLIPGSSWRGAKRPSASARHFGSLSRNLGNQRLDRERLGQRHARIGMSVADCRSK